MNEIEKIEQVKQVQAVNPMQLISMAVQGGADMDSLERLMALQERWEASQSKKAFFDALAKFQANCPDIIKTKKAHNSFYAPLGDIVAQIKGLLAECGLSIRFEQDHQSGVSVTCVVNHRDGHCEKTTMSAPADGSGNKNAIQAIASTVSYLQRYTLISALGITTADADMDGRLPVGDTISDDECQWLYSKLCDDTGHYTNFGQRIATLHKITDFSLITRRQFDKIKQQVK